LNQRLIARTQVDQRPHLLIGIGSNALRHAGNLSCKTHKSQFCRINYIYSDVYIIPTAFPARSNMPRIVSTSSLECSAQSEQRSSVMPAGVAGGRARLT